MHSPHRNTRRSLLCGAAAGISYALGRPVTAAGEQKNKEEVISPTEDLMREHGMVDRILLIYEEAIRRLKAGTELPPAAIRNSASIIRSFVEDYHEKMEEDHLFARFEKAGVLAELSKTLKDQHDAGRKLTDVIQHLAGRPSGDAEARRKMEDSLGGFIRMYRPHKAREDTVLFPAVRKVASPHDYEAMGDTFEKTEHRLFGENGFHEIVEKVAAIEKQLGIYELAQFMPR